VLLADLDARGKDSLLARRIVSANTADTNLASEDVQAADTASARIISGDAESAS
jgi:hypothetical protein